MNENQRLMNKFEIKRLNLVFLLLCMILAGLPSAASDYGRSYLLPEYVKGISSPVISLNGEWEFRLDSASRWTMIEVPGEAAMQGHAVRHDVPFFYRRTVDVPEDFGGNRVILRFDGTYSKARLYVNGAFVRSHSGGFTRWETDITPFVKPGGRNLIALELTDPIDDISYASGYAHHPVGGILRDVTLFAVPQGHIYDISMATDLDSLYKDAIFHISGKVSRRNSMKVNVTLVSPEGDIAGTSCCRTEVEGGDFALSIPVLSPEKWDAEHPELYGVKIDVLEKGKIIASHLRHIGFREVEIDGDRMLVNGRQVKLRGACRHDVHPFLGRAATVWTDSLDAVLFKEANMNFVRTSHYPPTERFIEFCDRYGIYVECETAVCFVNTYRQRNYAPGASHDDPAYSEWYLSQCMEMVKSMRNHPSVLFWSIGNESTYGSNFQKSYDYVKATDTTRPVIFSYPGSAPDDRRIYDIASMHYQDIYGNLDQWGVSSRNFQVPGLPAIFDEWAHPACYTYATLQNDPGIREFWGQSLDMMWSGLFGTAGGLGGAIWGYVDETFCLPEPVDGDSWWKEFAYTAKPKDMLGNCVGYGEWGIVDIWRRRKPEFWATKKAYSPVRIETTEISDFTPGLPLTIQVYNRYDHTFLDEIHASFVYGGVRRPLAVGAIAPERGFFRIPSRQWRDGDTVRVEFSDKSGTVDSYLIMLGSRKIEYPEPVCEGDRLDVSEADGELTVSGEVFRIVFDKATGLVKSAFAGAEQVLGEGPYLNLYINLNHLSGAEVRKMADHLKISPEEWNPDSFRWFRQDSDMILCTSGHYGAAEVYNMFKVSPKGEFSVTYTVTNVPNGYLREQGVSFVLPSSADSLHWERDGYWDCYPEYAVAGNKGAVSLSASDQAGYGRAPVQRWGRDTREYYYWSDRGAACETPLTREAKGMKENIYYYTVSMQGGRHSVSAVSRSGSIACRMDRGADEKLVMHINNRWDYPEIAWGNYCRQEEALPCYGTVTLILE